MFVGVLAGGEVVEVEVESILGDACVGENERTLRTITLVNK